ncbi:hypothetical protein [Polyangium spumosum]|uniref:Lipoprotein n=1 Tax=Polyangium spumosum TaxID=889282 RepID=A0A6N7PHV8_9BACT|nr:hypothetical protein [Polyangium spumosum]MRG90386.1 hypothetical protein [Polyangium spumosum]
MKETSLFFAGLGLVVALATGCGGPDIEAMCEAQEACLGGNEADLEACIVQHEAYRDAAYGVGCGEEFDALFACTEPLLACSTVTSSNMCTSDDDCYFNGVCRDGACTTFEVPVEHQSVCADEANEDHRCIL